MSSILVLGSSNKMGQLIKLDDFKWACGWYWGGGYVGNDQCHYHIDSYFKVEGKHTVDAIKEDFGESLRLTDAQLWRFCDLFKQFYSYREAAECFSHGGHYTSQGRKEDEINKEMAAKINKHLEEVIIREIRLLCKEVK